MKKIFLIMLLLPIGLFAQSDADNQQAIDSLKTNTAKKNNATFLWRLYSGLNDSKVNKDSSKFVLTTTGTSGAATYVNDTLNVPIYTTTTSTYTYTTNGSGSLQTAATIATSSNKNVIYEVTMVANRVSGGSAGFGSWVKLSASYKNISGTLTQIGSTDSIISHINDSSSPILEFDISSSNILLSVTPGSGVVYNIKLVVTSIEL